MKKKLAKSNVPFVPASAIVEIPKENIDDIKLPDKTPELLKKIDEAPLGKDAKKKITEYITESEVHQLVEIAKAQALTRPELMKFLLEQVFGKAPQSIGLDIPDGTSFGMIFMPMRPDEPLKVKNEVIEGDSTL